MLDECAPSLNARRLSRNQNQKPTTIMQSFAHAQKIISTLGLDPLLPSYSAMTYALADKTQGKLGAYVDTNGNLVVGGITTGPSTALGRAGAFDLSGSTGAFTTPTGLNTLSGKVVKKGGATTTYTGTADAIDISLGDVFILNHSGGINAATLADPAAGDEGREIWIKNGTTQANTITIASGLGGSGGSYDVITLTNVVAANVLLRAFGTKWYIIGGHLAAVA
jgi:hypothetical protein